MSSGQIKSWQAAKSQTFGAYNSIIDYKGVQARGPLTVEVPLVAPVGTFPSIMTVDTTAYIVPAGSSATELERHPVGTGPFKFVSFTPGTQSVFVRNPNYWQHGKPLVDQVVINSSFSDETARLNAFLASDLDIIGFIPPLEATQIASSSSAKLLRARSPNTTLFYMDVKRPPFTDVRVRQALRLLVDRQALVAGALAGYGTVGNDLMGVGAEFFAADLVRDRDVEQAKSLLKAAGKSGLMLNLSTSSAGAGFNEAATLFAEQAAAGGVKIVPQELPPSTYYNAPAYPYTFGLDYFTSRGSLGGYYFYSFKQYDDTRWGFDELMTEAYGAYPQSGEKWRAVQETQFNQGGYIVWGQQDNLDALASNVHGMTPSPVNSLSNWNLNDAWLA